MQIHIVKQGEVLCSIAAAYGADLNQVVTVNQITDQNRLVIGQAIVIPIVNKEYIVQIGDNLWTLARDFGVSVQDFMEENNLVDPALIQVGEMLNIPSFSHVIRAGETLSSISRKYGVAAERVIEINKFVNSTLIYTGQSLRIPIRIKPLIEVNAYMVKLNKKELQILGRNFTYVSPHIYEFNEKGFLTGSENYLVLDAAKVNRISPLLVLTNFQAGRFNSDLVAKLLSDSSVQETLMSEIVNEMKANDYKGLSIDFECIYPNDRDNYTEFLRKVVATMHLEGYSVSTVLASRKKADQEEVFCEAYDYVTHGRIADFIMIMVYGWAGRSDQVISPINQIKDVLDYAVKFIPHDKIMLGIPLCARDSRMESIKDEFMQLMSSKDAVELAVNRGITIQYNETYQLSFFHYMDDSGQEHKVLFEDVRSMQAKYDLVKRYELRGISYWELGNEFQQNWSVLQDNFKIKKL